MAITPEPAAEAVSAGSGRRLTAITIDQGVSSLSNVLIVLLGARVLGVGSFGLFAVVAVSYTLTQGFARALVGEPLLIRPEESRDRPGEAVGSALVLGLGVAAVVGAAGLITSLGHPDLGRGLMALAVFLPFMMIQDVGRYLAVATRQPVRALVLDLVWLGLELIAVGAIVIADAKTLPWFVIAWCGSGAAASLVLLWQLRGHRIRPGIAWLRETWPFSWRYATSFATRQGSVLIAASFVAAALGDHALSGYYGAITLFGAQVQFQAAAIAAGTSEVARVPARSPEVRRHVRRTTILTAGASAINLFALVVVPNRLGRVFLGDVWNSAHSLVWPAGLQMMCIALVAGVRSGLLGMRAAKTTLRVDVVQTVLTVGTTVVAAQFLDIHGTYWTLAVVQAGVAVLWWTVFERYMRHGAGVDEVPAATA